MTTGTINTSFTVFDDDDRSFTIALGCFYVHDKVQINGRRMDSAYASHIAVNITGQMTVGECEGESITKLTTIDIDSALIDVDDPESLLFVYNDDEPNFCPEEF